MSWKIIEGLDRTGKSTIADYYKSKGYQIIHMSAPDKMYAKDGYAGPSYLDDLLEIYMRYDNHDVIFDRSPYGEMVWPHVYGRKPMLEEYDYEVLREFEDKNNAQRILMIDPNTDAHWQRCVENNEPLNISQFKVASALFNKMAHKFNFVPRQLGDFDELATFKSEDTSSIKEEITDKERQDETDLVSVDTVDSNTSSPNKDKVSKEEKTEEQKRLEKANAINSVLSKRIIRQKGLVFDKLEQDIKTFLNNELSVILGSGTNTSGFTDEETEVLKLYVKQLKDKLKG